MCCERGKGRRKESKKGEKNFDFIYLPFEMVTMIWSETKGKDERKTTKDIKIKKKKKKMKKERRKERNIAKKRTSKKK